MRAKLLVKYDARCCESITYAMLHSSVNGIFASHQSASGRCADRSDIISIEQQPRIRQRIDIRRWDLTRTVKTDVVPSLIKMTLILNVTF